jgi:hypothetical protein
MCPMTSTSTVGSASSKKLPASKRQALLEPMPGDVTLEHGLHRLQVEAIAGQMRMPAGDLDGQRSFGAAEVGEGLVLPPWERRRDGPRRRQADARHGAEEHLEPPRVGVDGLERIGATAAGLVLRRAGDQRFREIAPEAVQAPVHHLEDAADVRRLGAIEIVLRLGRVGIPTVRQPLQHAERHEGIEEVARGALMQADAPADLVEACRPGLGQDREHPELDRAQEGLRAPERGSELQDSVRGNRRHLRHRESRPLGEDAPMTQACFRVIAPSVSSGPRDEKRSTALRDLRDDGAGHLVVVVVPPTSKVRTSPPRKTSSTAPCSSVAASL